MNTALITTDERRRKCSLHSFILLHIRNGSTMALKNLKVKHKFPTIVVSIMVRDHPRLHEDINMITLRQKISLPSESNIMTGWRGLQAGTIRDHHGELVVKGPRLHTRASQNIFTADQPIDEEVVNNNIHLIRGPTFKAMVVVILSRKEKIQLNIVHATIMSLWTT